jgi:integrase
VVHALTDDELKRLIRACQGKSLVDRRDEAIVRLMLEAGLRAGEVVGLQVSDVDVSRGLVTITRDKGGKGRIAPFGPQTAQALDRYLRVRRSHRLADAGAALVTRCGAGRWAFGGAVRFAAAASTALSTSMCRSRRGGAFCRYARPPWMPMRSGSTHHHAGTGASTLSTTWNSASGTMRRGSPR